MAESLGVLLLALVVGLANLLNVVYILFPELAALANDVFVRPAGKWAKEPWKLVATPTATAVVGTLVASRMPYGVISILLTMTLSLGVIFSIRSAVSPAISAGVLPIVLGVKSWLYPLCILCNLAVLTGLLLLWKSFAPGRSLSPIKKIDDRAVDILESPPKGRWWFPALFLFVALIGLTAQLTAWRFILFPPLIVMAYEMLGHTNVCPWAKAPFTFPIVCTLAALLGVEAVKWLGGTPISAVIVLTLTIGILRLVRLRMPPALAIGLIPFVIAHPSLKYPLSVGIGTVALTVWFIVYRKLSELNTAPTIVSQPQA